MRHTLLFVSDVSLLLNNLEAQHALNVYSSIRLLSFYLISIYFEVNIDRSLTFYHHLVALRKNNLRASHC